MNLAHAINNVGLAALVGFLCWTWDSAWPLVLLILWRYPRPLP